MSDINPDVPDKPIVVNATPVADQVNTITRDILLILSVLPALIAVLGTRDVAKITGYIGSAEFLPVLGLIVTTGVVLWRQWTTRKRHANDVKMAESASNSVAIVKEK